MSPLPSGACPSCAWSLVPHAHTVKSALTMTAKWVPPAIARAPICADEVAGAATHVSPASRLVVQETPPEEPLPRSPRELLPQLHTAPLPSRAKLARE